MKHDTHTQHIMKDTDSFYIRLCNCGVVHLCFGATTLNLSEQAVIAVTETLNQVSEEIIMRKRNEIPHPATVIQGNFTNLPTG